MDTKGLVKRPPSLPVALRKRLKNKPIEYGISLLRDLGYSDAEISIVYGVELSTVKGVRDPGWAGAVMQLPVQDRSQEILRKVLSLSDFRMSILADCLTQTGNVLPILAAMRAEETHRIEKAQSLGAIPKEAEKMQIQGGLLEAAVLMIGRKENKSSELSPIVIDQTPELATPSTTHEPPSGVYAGPEDEEAPEGVPLSDIIGEDDEEDSEEEDDEE
jgi:hypothetical protein